MTLNTKISPNLKQSEAIGIKDGPVMLLAGPGTGKTYTLIQRIQAMLKDGIEAKNILCLTFSDAASSEMKTRLVQNASSDALEVNVSTYHSFCSNIIKQYPSKFELMDNITVVDDITKQTIVKECLEEYDINFLKDKWGNKYHYVGQIISGIDVIKRERTCKEDFYNYIETNPDWMPLLDNLKIEEKERTEKGKINPTFLKKLEAQEKKIGKAKEFYDIFQAYEKKLKSSNLIDFADMLNLVLKTLEVDDELLIETTYQYKYILVDEYQDTNSSQNELIFLISKGAATDNIFVVGDDDQIIYSFQGARCDNLKTFLLKYPNTKVICLNENNRSSQTILDFAESIIENDPTRLTNDADFKDKNIEKKLTAKNFKVITKDSKINFSFYADAIQENNKIAEEIKMLINNGVDPKEIAILARKNDSLIDFTNLFKAKNIPYQLNKQKSVFEIPAFIVAYFYLKSLDNIYTGADKLFGLLTNEPFLIDDKDYFELLKLNRINGCDFFKNIEDNLNTIFKDSKKVQEFYNTFIELRKEKSYKGLTALVYDVIVKSGILEYYSNLQTDAFENTAAIKRLIKEANAYVSLHKSASLKDFVSHLDSYLNAGIKMEIEKNPYLGNAVQLLTYHGSKGREFEYVFMPKLISSLWEKSRGGSELDLPLKKSKFSDDKNINKQAEMLKLLFVGVTRSKFGLYLSYPNTIDADVQAMSTYIPKDVLDDSHLVSKKIYEMDLDTYIGEIKQFLNIKNSEESIIEELKQRVENIVVSPFSLNQYLSCPLKYYYSSILEIPVYIEDINNLSYGSAIHFMIEKMTRTAKEEGKYPDINFAINAFEEKMTTLEFKDETSRQEFLLRGKTSINKGYPKLIDTPIERIEATEIRLEYQDKGFVLKGFADRITKDKDGWFHIYDFKTGGHKKIKPDEAYHNQLRFYKYLYEKVNPLCAVKDCALVYFEDSCANADAELVDFDMEVIEEKINSFVAGAKSLNFEPTPCLESCRYCDYKLICRLAISDT